MLDYVANNPVRYCIINKVDRLARNRLDDAIIHSTLRAANISLVSVTENIDETPSGMLMHGILASIAEFYSLNLAQEVLKGMTQKASIGGTPMMAPLGYLNVRTTDDQGREVRDIEKRTDPFRIHCILNRRLVALHPRKGVGNPWAHFPANTCPRCKAVVNDRASQDSHEPLLPGHRRVPRRHLRGCTYSTR